MAQTPVPLETLEFQIRLAVNEASDLEFVPAVFRGSKALSRTWLQAARLLSNAARA
jgi:hypothetical protein